MTAGDTTAEVAEQQALLVALAATLNGVPVRYWLMGGWAVDAHLGRITRRHSDIDFAVLLSNRDALTEALRTHGLVPVPGAEPAGEFFDGGPCRVEITYLTETASGEVVTPGFEHWPYVSDASGRPCSHPRGGGAGAVDCRAGRHEGALAGPHRGADASARLQRSCSTTRPPLISGPTPPAVQSTRLPAVEDVPACRPRRLTRTRPPPGVAEGRCRHGCGSG